MGVLAITALFLCCWKLGSLGGWGPSSAELNSHGHVSPGPAHTKRPCTGSYNKKHHPPTVDYSFELQPRHQTPA